MTIKDPERKREVGKKWRNRRTKEGYGKAIYSIRKQRLANEKVLREAVEEAMRKILGSASDTEIWDNDDLVIILERIFTDALARAPKVSGRVLDYMPGETKSAPSEDMEDGAHPWFKG